MSSNESNQNATTDPPASSRPTWFQRGLHAVALNNLHRNTQTHRNAVRRHHAQMNGTDPAAELQETDPMHIGDVTHNHPPKNGGSILKTAAMIAIAAATGGVAAPALVGPVLDYWAKPTPAIERPADDREPINGKGYGLDISIGPAKE